MISLSKPQVVFCRFICATILHITLIDEFRAKLNIMKFICNHEYKFESPVRAYLMALLFILSSTAIEYANILVMYCYGDTFDLISSFVSLVVVKEFDNFIYNSIQNENLKSVMKCEPF